MSIIVGTSEIYHKKHYDSEADLESAILQVQTSLFGANRIYLDIKKKIGTKAGLQNIPDGYLIDISGKRPRLFVVENELASHDPLRHIAVQILQFSLSFESEPRLVKTILFNGLQAQQQAKLQCESYANSHGFRNLDHMLEWLVFESPFAALVIIDEMPDNLENILAKKFQFGVEVLELARYENQKGERLYQFEPFLADVLEDTGSGVAVPEKGTNPLDSAEIDTVVVPAREDGFQETFLREDRWYAIRVHGTMRPQIKYIAIYRVAPKSAITHLAPVRSIEPWRDSEKYVVNLAEPAKEIGPIPLVKGGRVKGLQNLRYTNHQRLENAKTLDDVW